MNKILITLIVPSVGFSYDVFVPGFLTIRELLPLLAEALADITEHQYVMSGCEKICRCEPYIVLEEDYTLEDYGIMHGDQMYLF